MGTDLIARGTMKSVNSTLGEVLKNSGGEIHFWTIFSHLRLTKFCLCMNYRGCADVLKTPKAMPDIRSCTVEIQQDRIKISGTEKSLVNRLC